MAKELREALYRARATMAEASHQCSQGANDSLLNKDLTRLTYQTIDRLMQSGVEDADRSLIEYEKTKIFHLWVCPSCGNYQLPDGGYGDGEESVPECTCGRFFGDPVSGDNLTEMDKVMVERMD